MSELLNLVTPLHKRTTRDYWRRTTRSTACQGQKHERTTGMAIAAGWRLPHDGRWKPVAERLIDRYKLGPQSRSRCGVRKAHLPHEIVFLPEAEVSGFTFRGTDSPMPRTDPPASVPLPGAGSVSVGRQHSISCSLGAFHNLRIFEPRQVRGRARGKNKYIMVESYRTSSSSSTECWALTAEAFFDTAEWIWHKHFGYTGDYEFIYFE